MIKEKVTSLIKKDNSNNKKKIENMIFALVLLIITLISINIIFKGEKKEKNQIVEESTKVTEKTLDTSMEEKIEEILSQIKGVENVKVLITYSETEKVVPIYNESSSQSTTEETDNEGGTRTIESYNNNKEVISDSSQTPVTEKTILPKIEGAVITAKGAGDLNIKENIINAVQAATGLARHKIQVFESK